MSIDSLERLGVFKEADSNKLGLYLALSKTSSLRVQKQLVKALDHSKMTKAVDILIRDFETKEQNLVSNIH